VAEDKITALGRELGGELRRTRERAGYNGKDMATRLGWSTTKVSRVEVGARPISEEDIVMYLASCGLKVDEIDPILDLARERNLDHRMKSHGEKLPDELKTLIFHETTAAEINNFEPIFIPGLVQTEGYIRALLHEGDVHGDSVELRVRARMKRQLLLKKPAPPRCRFYVHENALRARIGSAKIMRDQVLHLLFVATLRYCDVRVLPVTAGGRGLAFGPFQPMTYVEHEPVVYTEHDAFSLFLDRGEHAGHYRRVLNRLGEAALGEGESRRFLADLADELDRSESHGAQEQLHELA
jgi:transcriptional regulator with XRE-family HTH domain